MTVTIREFTRSDSVQLIALVRELQGHEAQFFDRMKAPDEIGAWYLHNLQKACATHDGVILVADQGEAVVGYAVLLTAVLSEDMPEDVDSVYALVMDLAVAGQARRKGIGTKLLEACESRARKAGVRWLRISALAENHDAIAAYEKFGFKNHLLTMEKPL